MTRSLILLSLILSAAIPAASTVDRGIDESFFAPGGSLDTIEGPEAATAVRPAVGTGMLAVRVLVILGVICAGLYGLKAFVSRKKGVRPAGRGGIMKSLGTEVLGPNRWVEIMEVGGKILVVGVTEKGMFPLTEITDKDERDAIKLAASGSEAGAPFGEELKRIIRRMGDSMKREEVIAPAAALRRERERLGSLTI